MLSLLEKICRIYDVALFEILAGSANEMTAQIASVTGQGRLSMGPMRCDNMLQRIKPVTCHIRRKGE